MRMVIGVVMALPCTPTAWETFADYLAGEFVAAPYLVGHASDGVEVYGRVDWLYRRRGEPCVPVHHMLGVRLDAPRTDAPIELRLNRAPAADKDFFIESDASDETVQAVLAGPDVRAALRALLGISDVVTICPDSLRVSMSEAQFHDPQHAQERLERLAMLRRLLAFGMPSPYRTEAPNLPRIVPARSRVWPNIAMGLAAAVGVMAWVSWAHDDAAAPVSLTGPASLLGMVAGGLLWAIGTLLIALVLRGRMKRQRDVALASIALLALVPAGEAHAMVLNAAYDAGPTAVRQATIQKRVVRKGNGTYFEVKTPWRKGQSPIELGTHRVNGAQNLEVGDEGPATVTTRPGWLATEWIVRVDAADKVRR